MLSLAGAGIRLGVGGALLNDLLGQLHPEVEGDELESGDYQSFVDGLCSKDQIIQKVY